MNLFFERLNLWYRLFDGDGALVGPLVAGRLRSKAQWLAITLRLPRPDGQIDVSSDALTCFFGRGGARPCQSRAGPSKGDSQRDAGIMQCPFEMLLGSVTKTWSAGALKTSWSFTGESSHIQEYSIEWEARLEKAISKAERCWPLLPVLQGYSQLNPTIVEDIKLKIQGGLQRFNEARALALRLVSRKEDSGIYSYYAMDEHKDDAGFEAWYEQDDG